MDGRSCFIKNGISVPAGSPCIIYNKYNNTWAYLQRGPD